MRKLNLAQFSRVLFFVLALIFSVSVALQVLIAGIALFVNSGSWLPMLASQDILLLFLSSWQSWHGWQDFQGRCSGRA